jgi:hypothetical protein
LGVQPCNDNTGHAKAEQQGLLYDINPVTLTSSTAPKNINGWPNRHRSCCTILST